MRNEEIKKVAFTLAEVLISLGIIGIVAAMTMPVLIGKYQEHVTVNKVKKFYSMISQAVLMSINDNGIVNNWNIPSGINSVSANELADYIKPYIKIARDCGTTSSGCTDYMENTKYLSGNKHESADSYKNFSGYYRLILADGSRILLRGVTATDTKKLGVIYFDVNGEQGPNTIGKDIHNLYIKTQGI